MIPAPAKDNIGCRKNSKGLLNNMVGAQAQFFTEQITNSFLKDKISEYLIDRLSNLLAMDFDLRQPELESVELHIADCLKRLQIHFSAYPDIKHIDDFEGIFQLFTIAIQEEKTESQAFNPDLGQGQATVAANKTVVKKSEGSHAAKVTSAKSQGASGVSRK